MAPPPASYATWLAGLGADGISRRPDGTEIPPPAEETVREFLSAFALTPAEYDALGLDEIHVLATLHTNYHTRLAAVTKAVPRRAARPAPPGALDRPIVFPEVA